MNGKVNHTLLKASGITALVMAAALLFGGLLELSVYGMKNRLGYLDAGKRWSADGARYAVIGMYAEESAGISADQAESWAHSTDNALLEASVTPAEGARSWAYCYGMDSVLQVVGPKGTANAETIAANGDFFVFHHLKFTFGGGFLNDPTNPMGVVLDRNLAWRVYGAENIVGKSVIVNGEEFTIVGIADMESSSEPYKRTYGSTPRMYMSYAGFSKIGTGNITFFEAALPNAVKGFAYNIFTRSVQRNEDSSAVIEATDRFSLKNRWDNMKELSYAWISANRIKFPYWENEARVYDYRAAVVMLFETAFAAIAGASLILAVILLRFSGWSLIGVMKRLFAKISERNSGPPREKKIRRRKQPADGGGENPSAPEPGPARPKPKNFKRIRHRKI